METPDISLIIAIYNNPTWLEMIFNMLEKQTFKHFEVILADDGSNEESVGKTKELMAHASFPVNHVWHEDQGWRKDIILNKAVVASQAPYLVFIDGDCIPDRHFMMDHFNLKKKGSVIGGRRVQLTQKMSEEITPALVKDEYLSRQFFPLLFSGQRHAEDVIRIGNPTVRKYLFRPKPKNLLGCNFGIYKSDLLLVNGFDERYLSPATGEDTDLEARLARIGIGVLRVRFICRMYHRFHRSAGCDATNENVKILNWNRDNNISFTPFGIKKEKNSKD